MRTREDDFTLVELVVYHQGETRFLDSGDAIDLATLRSEEQWTCGDPSPTDDGSASSSTLRETARSARRRR